MLDVGAFDAKNEDLYGGKPDSQSLCAFHAFIYICLTLFSESQMYHKVEISIMMRGSGEHSAETLDSFIWQGICETLECQHKIFERKGVRSLKLKSSHVYFT